jgi:hypothetical protein
MPGINWGIWTVGAAVGLVVVVWRARGAVEREVGLVLGLACALALGAAVTADPDFHFLIFVGCVTLLAIAMLLGSGVRARAVGVVFIALAPLIAAVRALVEAGRRALEGIELLRGGRSIPALRGAVIALPVMAGFALLLSAADPILASWRDGVIDAVRGWTFLPRAIFFCMVSAFVLGAYGSALRAAGFEWTVPRIGVGLARLGDVERLITLAGVALVFALFLVLQLSYLFGNAPAVQGSGVTYAEYARRGFGEITVAATLAVILIVGLDLVALRGARERRVRVATLVLIALVQLLLVSAWRRVVLYEAAYGFTAARLYAQVYMVAVTLCLLALAYEVWVTLDPSRLARRAALIAIAALLALVYWNHEGWIARRNLARFADTGKLDVRYVARRLGLNAVPDLVHALPHLPPPIASELRSCLAERYAAHHALRPRRWYEWNFRRTRARAALVSASLDPGMRPPPVHRGRGGC